jgi:hypothetical protein
MFLKTDKGKALKLLAKQKIVASTAYKAATKLGSLIVGAVGTSALIPGGIIIGVALCAALIIWEYSTTTEKPTL